MTKVKIRSRKPSLFAYIEHRGAHEEIPYEKYIEKVFAWTRKKRAKPRFKPMAVFHDDPEKTPPENCRSEIGFVVRMRADPEDDIKIREIPAMSVATIKHKGPGEDYPKTYKELSDWIVQNGYEITGSFMELYTKKPRTVGGKTILYSEIQVPVKAK